MADEIIFLRIKGGQQAKVAKPQNDHGQNQQHSSSVALLMIVLGGKCQPHDTPRQMSSRARFLRNYTFDARQTVERSKFGQLCAHISQKRLSLSPFTICTSLLETEAGQWSASPIHLSCTAAAKEERPRKILFLGQCTEHRSLTLGVYYSCNLKSPF
jgi:hypothetical protein